MIDTLCHKFDLYLFKMLNTVLRISQNLKKLSQISCRSVVIKFVRPNTTYTNVFRSQKQKKEEGGEAIKWILLV